MSDDNDTATVSRTHNMPPVVLPKDEEMLADLQRRFPEIDKRLAEWDDAFKEYPEEITLAQEDIAQNLQDLLGQVKKESKIWTDSFAKNEKSPLNKLVKIVGNFFTTRSEKADAFLAKWGPVHEAFLTKKKADNIRKQEEAAEAQRKKEEDARAAALAAEAEKKKAEEAAAAARKKEEEAIAAAAAAEEEKRLAEERTRLALAQEKRLADEKRERDKAEKEVNNTNLREIRGYMRRAEVLNTLADTDKASEEELKELDTLVKAGGIIGNLASPVANSLLLDEDQKTAVEGVRTRLGELRVALNDRFGKREQKRREKEATDAAAKEAKLVEERRIAREAHDKELADAKKKREEEEAGALLAKEEKRKAEQAARDARGDVKEADADAKTAGKQVKQNTSDADQAANRAGRIESRLDNSSDADHSRTRGDLGTVGSLAKRWNYYITDEDALRAGFVNPDAPAPSSALAEHLTTDALEGAVFRWMRVHQGSWGGRERIEGELPGVVFAHEQEARIV